jgi:hypothetical protein
VKWQTNFAASVEKKWLPGSAFAEAAVSLCRCRLRRWLKLRRLRQLAANAGLRSCRESASARNAATR